MTGWQRMWLGEEHEQQVTTALTERGWHVERFGQGLFSERIHAALRDREPPTLLRWLPDLIAVRVMNRRERIVLIDAKATQSDTPNHAVEIAAYIAANQVQLLWQIPVVYVFADLSCNVCTKLEPIRWEPNRTETRGSGTPYMLVRKCDQRSLDKWFGTPTLESEAA